MNDVGTLAMALFLAYLALVMIDLLLATKIDGLLRRVAALEAAQKQRQQQAEE